MHNTGGRALDMSGTLALSAGPGGLSAGPFPATLGVTLAIGATERVAIDLDDRLPSGPWLAEITLHSGLVERSARATISFPDEGHSATVRAQPTRSGWVGPGVAALALLLVMGLAVQLYVLAGRRRERTA